MLIKMLLTIQKTKKNLFRKNRINWKYEILEIYAFKVKEQQILCTLNAEGSSWLIDIIMKDNDRLDNIMFSCLISARCFVSNE